MHFRRNIHRSPNHLLYLSATFTPCDTVNPPQLLDTVFYWIQIKDRAGHLSNQIETAPITLICKRQ
jgi:hypothetical protein